ncbi:MAG: sulfotransferase [Vicingaceae bacterium]
MLNEILSHHRSRRVLNFGLLMYSRLYADKEKKGSLSRPLWVLGMFRSGTSLLTNFYVNIGYNVGPNSRLLQSVGIWQDLNPKGFFEDFIFADLSRYFLHLLGRSGDSPPTQAEVDGLNWAHFNVRDFISFSLINSFEDRISIINKVRCYVFLIRYGLDGYILSMGDMPIVKIPMLSFFYKLLASKWPLSRFVVIFRHPQSVLKSSQAITLRANEKLYCIYHEFLLDKYLESKSAYYISYDHIIANPRESFFEICKKEGIDKPMAEEKCISLIDLSLIRNSEKTLIEDNRLSLLYYELCSRAINIFDKSQ